MPLHVSTEGVLSEELSDEQLHYAGEDVLYLIPLFEDIRAMLEKTGRWQWFMEDMIDHGRYRPVDPQTYFTNIKKAWKLEGTICDFQVRM